MPASVWITTDRPVGTREPSRNRKLRGVLEGMVDVLQRVGQHPASQVSELTPRNWKQLFAAKPLRSPIHDIDHPLKNAA